MSASSSSFNGDVRVLKIQTSDAGNAATRPRPDQVHWRAAAGEKYFAGSVEPAAVWTRDP